MHVAIVLLILILTYIGMAAGRIAWLQVDRTGIALLAVIALLASGEMTLDDFGSAVDLPTLAFLFAMMIISAQFAESGFIDLCARTITENRHGTATLAGVDGRNRRRAVGDTRKRHSDNSNLAVADRRSAEPWARSSPVGDRACCRDQCGLRGDPDRQSAKHPDWGPRPARLLGFPGDLRRAGDVHAHSCLSGRLAAMAHAHQPDGARGDPRSTAANRSSRSTATRRSRGLSPCWCCSCCSRRRCRARPAR